MREHDLIHEIELNLFSAHFKAGFLSCIMAMKVYIAPASRNTPPDPFIELKKKLDGVGEDLKNIGKRLDKCKKIPMTGE